MTDLAVWTDGYTWVVARRGDEMVVEVVPAAKVAG